MALPKLKNATYELTLPSTGVPMHYRPFLVKEQKLLMIAQESEDQKQLEAAFGQILTDCVEEITDPYKMPMFDVEYVFLKIRSKSVGEVVKLKLLCRDDNVTFVDVELNLDDIDVQMTVGHTNIYHRVDMDDTELDDFIDSMSTENFEKVSEFFETMPKLKHVVEVENPKTKVKNEIVIEGLESFFE